MGDMPRQYLRTLPEEAYSLYASRSATPAELADRYGTTSASVMRLMRERFPDLRFGTGSRSKIIDHAEMLRLYKAGESMRELAARYDVSHELIRQRIRLVAPEMIGKRGKTAPFIAIEELKRLAATMPTYKLAKHLKTSHARVRDLIIAHAPEYARHGVSGAAPTFDHDGMIQKYAAGATQSELAINYETSQSGISAILRRKAPHILRPRGRPRCQDSSPPPPAFLDTLTKFD
jgi:uncharacterized protein (DUF433 family)